MLGIYGHVRTNADSVIIAITACSSYVNQLVSRFDCYIQLLGCNLAVFQGCLNAVIGSEAAATAAALNRNAVATLGVAANACSKVQHKAVALRTNAGIFSSINRRIINKGIIAIFYLVNSYCRASSEGAAAACVHANAYCAGNKLVTAGVVGKRIAIIIHLACICLSAYICLSACVCTGASRRQNLVHSILQIVSSNLGIGCQLVLVDLYIVYATAAI